MLAGERLYAGMIDLNPPFIFWLSVPAALAGGGEASILAFRILVLGVLGAALAALWPLSRTLPAVRAGFVLMAVGLTIGFFGEREHLLLALIVPYIAVAIARAEGRAVSGLVAGLLAGLGMALKPHAALLGVAIALDAWRRERSWRVLFRAEHLAAGAVLAAALVAILAFAPDYLAVVRRYGPSYAEFSRGTLGQLLFRHWYAIGSLIALGVALVAGRWVGMRSRVTVPAVAAGALLAAAVLQGKGFGYHYVPAMGIAVILLLELLLAAPSAGRWQTPARRVVAALALALLLSLPVYFTLRRAVGTSGGNVVERAALSRALRDLGPGSRVAVLSIRLGDAYPLILDRRWDHVLPVAHLWFVDSGEGPAVAELWGRVARAVRDGRPDAVIVRAPRAGEAGPGDEDVSYVDLLCRTSGAAAALRDYGLATHAGGFDIYRPGVPGAAPCSAS